MVVAVRAPLLPPPLGLADADVDAEADVASLCHRRRPLPRPLHLQHRRWPVQGMICKGAPVAPAPAIRRRRLPLIRSKIRASAFYSDSSVHKWPASCTSRFVMLPSESVSFGIGMCTNLTKSQAMSL